MTAKVGDTVAKVEDGMMVRDADGVYAVRLGDHGRWVSDGQTWHGVGRGYRWRWNRPLMPSTVTITVTIIASGLTGSESADDLKRLAEVFDIRTELRTESGLPGFTRVYFGDEMVGGFSGGDGLSYWAGRLHATGFRAGMTPDDAARLPAGGTEQ